MQNSIETFVQKRAYSDRQVGRSLLKVGRSHFQKVWKNISFYTYSVYALCCVEAPLDQRKSKTRCRHRRKNKRSRSKKACKNSPPGRRHPVRRVELRCPLQPSCPLHCTLSSCTLSSCTLSSCNNFSSWILPFLDFIF